MCFGYFGLALILALVIFLPWRNNYFCSDDWPAFLRNMHLSWQEIPGWFTGLRSGSYRPLHDVFVALCWSRFGLNPLGYRLVSIILYVLVSANVGMLAYLITGDKRVGTLSTVLFSVFAPHAEPVLWLAATNELLAGLFALICITSFVIFRRTGHIVWLVAAGLGCLLELTSKETTLLLPLMIFVYDVLFFEPTRDKRPNWRFVLPSLSIFLLWLVFLIFRIPLGSAYTSAVQFTIPRLAMNFAYYMLIGVFAIPNDYAFLASLRLWQTLPALPVVILISSTVTITVTSWLWFRGRSGLISEQCKKSLLFSLVWTILALGPVIFIVSERSVFLSSVGSVLMLSILFVGAWDVAKRRSKRMEQTVAIVIVLYIALNVCVLGYRSAWFGQSAKTSKAVLMQLDDQIQRLPTGTAILLVNLPDHLGYTFTFRNTFPSATRVLEYDLDIKTVLDTDFIGLSPRQQENYVNQLKRASNAVVFWYRDGRLVPGGN